MKYLLAFTALAMLSTASMACQGNGCTTTVTTFTDSKSHPDVINRVAHNVVGNWIGAATTNYLLQGSGGNAVTNTLTTTVCPPPKGSTSGGEV